MSESVFDLPMTLKSVNGGCSRYDRSQMYPISGAINNAVVGQGAASGLTTFQWQDSQWWSPCQSYFVLTCKFDIGADLAVNAAYADNFAMTLFTQINTQINSRPLDTVNTPWLVDTALTYSNAHHSFLRSFGSLTRVGEPLSTRIRNTNQNSGIVQVVFRPPVSIFDVELLPPGAQYLMNFNWASSGILAFESVNGSVTHVTTSPGSNEVRLTINEFSFYKATVTPGPDVQLPDRAVINLMPCTAVQYFLNSGNTLKQNITLPATANKILIGFQDINPNSAVSLTPPVDYIGGVGNGYNPATSFSNQFTTTNTPNQTFGANAASLSTLWLDLPEIGVQEPRPVYNFSTTNGILDYVRAYSDFCHITQGTKTNEEGSVPLGSMATAAGVTIIQPIRSLTTTPAAITTIEAGTIQIGDLNNPQQYTYIPLGVNTAAPPLADPLSYNQTAKWGWLGRCPGPIFAFPVVRPQGKYVTTGTLNMTTSGNVANISATVITSYNMAIVLTKQPNGYYNYDVIEGI